MGEQAGPNEDRLIQDAHSCPSCIFFPRCPAAPLPRCPALSTYPLRRLVPRIDPFDPVSEGWCRRRNPGVQVEGRALIEDVQLEADETDGIVLSHPCHGGELEP